MKKILLALLLTLIIHLLPKYTYSQDLALVGATIYPAPYRSPIINGIVLMHDGKITAVGNPAQVKVPAELKVLDCKDLILMGGSESRSACR